MSESDIEVRSLQQAIIEPASMQLAAQKLAQEKIQRKPFEGYKRLADAHMLAAGAIGSALMRVNAKRSLSQQDDKAHHQGEPQWHGWCARASLIARGRASVEI